MADAKLPAKQAKPGSRDARLAAALRENLRRRKAQERGRGAQADADSAIAAGDLVADDQNS